VYVCICKGITQKQLEDAVSTRKGQSARDVMKALGLGSDCGTCVEDAVEQMLQTSNKKPRRNHSSDKPTHCHSGE
jgi:bacterioferritin-associated ferredoxin